MRRLSLISAQRLLGSISVSGATGYPYRLSLASSSSTQETGFGGGVGSSSSGTATTASVHPPKLSSPAFSVPLDGSPIPPYPGYIADDEDAEYTAQLMADRAVSAKRVERNRQPMAVTPDEDQVDPFRVGYNMGMQNVQLETLRHKLDDNQELVKSHLTSLRETTRTNYDSLRRLHNEHHRLIIDEIKDNDEKLTSKFVAYGSTVAANEDAVRELTKQQFDTLQKHVDDRLENIKDTVKIGTFILIAINIGGLFYVSQQLQQQHQQNHGDSSRRGGLMPANSPSSAPSVKYYQKDSLQHQQQQQMTQQKK